MSEAHTSQPPSPVSSLADGGYEVLNLLGQILGRLKAPPDALVALAAFANSHTDKVVAEKLREVLKTMHPGFKEGAQIMFKTDMSQDAIAKEFTEILNHAVFALGSGLMSTAQDVSAHASLELVVKGGPEDRAHPIMIYMATGTKAAEMRNWLEDAGVPLHHRQVFLDIDPALVAQIPATEPSSAAPVAEPSRIIIP